MAAPVDPADLHHFGVEVLRGCGLTDVDAGLVADTLVRAELWGHPSHGMLRLPWYVARLHSSAVKADARPEIVADTGALVHLDGRDGMGQVVAATAVTIAVERAKAHGVGVVSVRHSNHFGTAMYYTTAAAEAGCVALLSTNASPAMPPYGGREKRIGTNPWSIAAPVTGRDADRSLPPMVLDVANTTVARGKIHLARAEGRPIPDGWALDDEGAPTTDPVKALMGTVLPMAGHKGSGVAIMMDVLSGVLSGGAFGADVHGPYDPDARGGVGHLMIAVDIEALMPLAEFHTRMQTLVTEIKETPRVDDVEEIFYPGELEARTADRHRRSGLTLPTATVTDLVELGRRIGVDVDRLVGLHEPGSG